MSIRYLIFGVISVTFSYLILYDSLLQNVTDVITKCDSYFITNATLLQNVTILLQNTIAITKCDIYHKLRQYSHLKTLANSK